MTPDSTPASRPTPDPDEFAVAWAAAWNAHDVEAVLAHFAEDAVFSSPVAPRVVPGSDGILRGKAALRDYWTTGIRGLPDLRFEVVGVYAGVDTLVINYRNQRGGLVCEVLTFADGLVVHGGGTYLADAASDVGAMDGEVLRLTGDRVVLVPVGGEHVEDLRRIRRTPEVEARWGVESYAPPWPFGDPDAVVFTVLVDDVVRGLIQYDEEDEPDYRHATIDLFLDPAIHSQGVGRDAVRTMVDYLLGERGHHRITIDPALGNDAAVRCYAAVGFRPVGVLRDYERDADGRGWHDGLMMELLADDR
jgi:RimJ/RimL family protein N-acetyltransferase/ketosteroid isomerase-like protein